MLMEGDEPTRGETTERSAFRKSILEALTDFENELRESYDAERHRAEQRLVESEETVRALRSELRTAHKLALEDVEHLVTAFRKYVDETHETQRSLFAITRRLLGLHQVGPGISTSDHQGAGSPGVSEDIQPEADKDRVDTVPPRRSRTRRPRPEESASKPTSNGRTSPTDSTTVQHLKTDNSWVEDDPQTMTDQPLSEDQRLIDLRNHMDMSRLDSMFRMSAATPRARRRRSG